MTHRQDRHLWIRSVVAAALALLLITGCGGGGGSTDSSGEETPPANRLLQAVETAVNTLDEEAEQGAALEKLYVGNELAGNLVPMVRGDSGEDADARACVTVAMEGETLILDFDGSQDCKSVSGTLRVTPVSADYGAPAILVYDVSLVDFDTGDGCPVNGEERSTVTIDGIHVTAEVTYTDLDLCGQPVSGRVVLEGETPTDWQLQMEARTYRYGNSVEAAVEMAWQPETGVMQGDLRVLLDGETYAMTAEAVVIDPACGLPTSGSLIITDPEGGSSVADFSDTRCESPLVRVSREGTTELWPLFDATP